MIRKRSSRSWLSFVVKSHRSDMFQCWLLALRSRSNELSSLVIMYVCMYACLYVCLCVCVSVYMSVCMPVCLCVSVCMPVCLCVCLYVCVCVCLYVCMYRIYVCMSVPWFLLLGICPHSISLISRGLLVVTCPSSDASKPECHSTHSIIRSLFPLLIVL